MPITGSKRIPNQAGGLMLHGVTCCFQGQLGMGTLAEDDDGLGGESPNLHPRKPT